MSGKRDLVTVVTGGYDDFSGGGAQRFVRVEDERRIARLRGDRLLEAAAGVDGVLDAVADSTPEQQ